ncbi:MAG: glutamate 5-kinase, partial [Planctomycetales bacterium]|nr:glutamate 5-kinase [Planctomycetales bacterium]
MPDLLRQEVIAAANIVVVKVGTRVLTHADGTLDETRIARLSEELNEIKETGRRVILVSSGAVGAGMSQLGLAKRPADLATLQAVAAIGQTKLIETYDRTFRRHGRHAAQVLLTAEDLDDRQRYLNVRNTLLALTQLNAVPIINENDTVAVEELATTFGDNDRLAALVTNLVRAPLLVILSDVSGLYTGDPTLSSSELVSTVTALDDKVAGFAVDKKTGHSKGGMASKLRAAKIVTSAGE